MSEKGGHGEAHHEAPHGKAEAKHGDGHGKAEHGHGKEKKEGFLKSVSKQLRSIFTITALFSLSLFVSESIAKPIAFETAKGAIETPARIISQAASKASEGGGHGGGGHGGDHGGGHH